MTVSLSNRTFQIAALGPESPLPMVGAPLESPYQVSAPDRPNGEIPQEIIDGSTYGNPRNMFPYSEQNGYGRPLARRTMRTVVLQNANLRAEFLPELGGRLWELTDLVTNTSLLHSPDTIQLANLALRNAWFAGGIEFNIGSRGHSPTTCSPLHTAVLRTADGTDLLRMWEFDRLRSVVFQLDVWLPEHSPVLLVAVRIRNPNTRAVPMYWWSNAAVPQDAGSRVVAPATSAFATAYSGGIARIDPTNDDGIDGTWPDRAVGARDYFFDIDQHSPAGRRPWIANVDQNGNGLAMISSARLRGRKLFVWGRSPGGEQWQRWLSPNGEQYAEIQAGLAQTQFQNLPMPAASEWSWVEAYGNVRADPGVAHGERDRAINHVQGRVDALVGHGSRNRKGALTGEGTLTGHRARSGENMLETAQRHAYGWADLPPQESVLHGSGWGAVESALRARESEPWIDETGTPFGAATISEVEQPWLDLLTGIPFAGASTFVAGVGWEARLAAQPHNLPAQLHRAVMVHARGGAEARALYEGVIARYEGVVAELDRDVSHARLVALAHRGLALLDLAGADLASPDLAGPDLASLDLTAPELATPELTAPQLTAPDRARADRAGPGTSSALSEYARACALDPGNLVLTVEAATAALALDAPEQAIRLLDAGGARPQSAWSGRLRFLRARALASSGHLEEAGELLTAGIEVADLREGEDLVADLWRQVFPERPVPPQYRFSMHKED
ncbi:DUF5107 domain-containing protein [Rathayibacter soli]|uniref:DUF5107 domain-containing protein n=1 Tax=Rathayibacter soli TaxID=3144168 RepID=UPI0027E3D930|nr:DUF5107 domain-containing protein [Glaciibacter superstes]